MAAFKMELYGRCVATSKPLLTKAQKQVRLAQAAEHLSWKLEQWARIVQTDECSFLTEGFRRVYITQQLDKKYEQSCYILKFRSYSSQTIYSSILVFRKGLIVVIKEEQGRLRGNIYREKVLSQVYYFIDQVV